MDDPQEIGNTVGGEASQEAASSTAAKLASSDDKRPDTEKIVFGQPNERDGEQHVL